ncbi:MAG: hypothetical protein ACFFFC_19535 [Candidatus Thorarchaeota archaeon]
MAYDVGTQVRFKCTFKDLDGNLADPSTVTAKIKDPAGNVETLVYGTDPDLKKDSVGIYYVDRTIDESGVWRHRWSGSGSLVVANEAAVRVEKQHVV